MRSCIQRRGNVYKVVPEMGVNWIGYADTKPNIYSSSTSSTLGAACACLRLTSLLPLFVAVIVAVVVFAASDPLDSSPFSPFLLFFDFFFFSYWKTRVSKAPLQLNDNGAKEEDNSPPATPKPA